MRRGGASSNTVIDHLTVLGVLDRRAAAGLPAAVTGEL
jgi:hypothetical protein